MTEPTPEKTATDPLSAAMQHFAALMQIARQCAHHLLSTNTFFKGLVESQMWATHAIRETAELKDRMANEVAKMPEKESV